MVKLADGTGSAHPPLAAPTNHARMSKWAVARYIKQALPDLSPHDFVQLYASIGAETNGKYTHQSVVNAVRGYQYDQTMPSVGTKWVGYSHDAITTSVNHGHKDWVSGFAYTSKDIPGSGGKSNLEKVSTGIIDGGQSVLNGGQSVLKGAGGFLSGNLMGIVVVIVIIILIAKK